ncbi:hypothetical protein FSHL1_012305 [Fusarium sambucinum]
MNLTMHDTTIREGPVLLDQMPVEILEFILSNVPSLDTLWNLSRASPRCWRIFAIRYASIAEAVLSGPNSTTPSMFRELIRAVALVRSHEFPFATLSDLKEDFLYDMASPYIRYERKYRGEVYITFGPGSLPKSRDIITSVIATAYHISALAQPLLASCLQRLERTKLTCIPIEPRRRSRFGPIYVHGMGQPTYIEEMRAVRALWIIQLVGEVKAMVQSRPNAVGWHKSEISMLSQMNPVSILPNAEFHFVAKEVETIMYYLPACYKNDTVFRLPQVPAPSQGDRWTTIHPRSSIVWDNTRPWDLARYRLEDAAYGLERESWGFNFLKHTMIEEPDLLPRLGFAFWDHPRLHSLGLESAFGHQVNDYRYWAYYRVSENTFVTLKIENYIAKEIF